MNDILSSVEEVTGALGGLERKSAEVRHSVSRNLARMYGQMVQSLDTSPMERYIASAAQVSAVLERSLTTLRSNFTRLKNAMLEAVAPIGLLVIPAMNQAVLAVLRLMNAVGSVIRALFGGAAAGKAMGKGLTDAAKAGKKASSAGSKVSRSLAGFDQLNRLNGPTGGTGTSGTSEAVLPQMLPDTLSPQLQVIVDRIKALLDPLRSIEFSALLQQLAGLGTAFTAFGAAVFQALEGVWHTLLIPLITWLLEQFAPVFLEALTMALTAVTVALEPLSQGLLALLQCMQPVFTFVGETAVLALNAAREAFGNMATAFIETGPEISNAFQSIGKVIATVFEVVRPILTALRDFWLSIFRDLGASATDSLNLVIAVLTGVAAFLENVFAGKWSEAWASIKDCLRGVSNGVIGFLNRILSGMVSAVNGVVRAVNRLSFQVPAWVPGLGGKRFGFSLSTVSAPSIPYLAKGAVLPANKPFLAVVGDQRHGTNVEAPLSTIQEAVALVMEDYAAGNMAGHEATVSMLRQILEAVLGICVGDELIAGAAQRQQSKMAVVTGGMW